MRILAAEQLQRIEEILGRPLASDECEETSALTQLSPQAIEVARRIAAKTRTLAVKYLVELVPGTHLSLAGTFLEDVVEGGMSLDQWRERNVLV